MKSVVIIEDQTAIREMVSEFISILYEIVGSFGNGEEGLQGCIKLKPDTVILDVGLPELSGTEVLRGLTLHAPGVKVLIFSGKASSANIRELLSAGAQGYVDKMDGFDEFKKALDIISGGGTFIGPKMASVMRSLILNPDSSSSEIPLSDREKQILQLVAESYSTKGGRSPPQHIRPHGRQSPDEYHEAQSPRCRRAHALRDKERAYFADLTRESHSSRITAIFSYPNSIGIRIAIFRKSRIENFSFRDFGLKGLSPRNNQ